MFFVLIIQDPIKKSYLTTQILKQLKNIASGRGIHIALCFLGQNF